MQPFSLHPLDQRFVAPKPIEEAPISRIRELEGDKSLIMLRKHNGHATFVTVTGTKRQHVGIYSRSGIDITEKFPQLVESVLATSAPQYTLIAAELTVPKQGVEQPGEVTKLTQSHVDRSLQLQRSGSVPQLKFFNTLVYAGRDVAGLPYRDRLSMLASLRASERSETTGLADIVSGTFDHACSESIRAKWEGLVLYDAHAGSEYRLDGKTELPPRPDGCWKWKDYAEGDFVATGWVPSTSNRFKGLVKDLLIAQYHPVSGDLVPWGKVGVGLTSSERLQYTDNSLYPMVFEVKFETRTKNNRLIAARILRRRFDKLPRECVSP